MGTKMKESWEKIFKDFYLEKRFPHIVPLGSKLMDGIGEFLYPKTCMLFSTSSILPFFIS